jgi:hypothetical protein
MRSLLVLALLASGCPFGADYHDPCSGQHDTTNIDKVLPAGDGTFYVLADRYFGGASVTSPFLMRIDGSGNTVWRKPLSSNTQSEIDSVEGTNLVQLFPDRMVIQPIDGGEPTVTMLSASCEAEQHFADGVVLGHSGTYDQPCVFSVGSTAQPVSLGDYTEGAWIVTQRAPDGGFVSWHEGRLWRFDAAGAVKWRTDVPAGPEELVNTSRGWLVVSGTTVVRVPDDGSPAQSLFTGDDVQHAFEWKGQIGVLSSAPDARALLTFLDADSGTILEPQLPLLIGLMDSAVVPVDDGVVLIGPNGLAQLSDSLPLVQHSLTAPQKILDVMPDGSYLVVDWYGKGCFDSAKLGLMSASGTSQWWTPALTQPGGTG